MVRWVVGLIIQRGPMTGVTKAVVCAILSMGWCIKKNPCCYSERVAAVGFLSRYLNGSLPYVRRYITLNKMC